MTNDTARTVAVLGSSGGNLRSHGGDDPARLLAEVARQVRAAGLGLGVVQFVAAQASMDGIDDSTAAELWALVEGRPTVVAQGPLSEVNVAARAADAQLAERVESGEIDALILVSADPTDTNAATVRAAVAQGLPAAGTGGTSIANAQQAGLNLVAVSGTTGTTSTTRAVSYVAGLARHWKIRYQPLLGGSSESSAVEGPAWRRISIRGIMVGSIPAFIALALVLAISKIPGLQSLTEVFDLLMAGLPVVVAAVAARRVSALDEVGLVAGAVTGVLAVEGGILGGLVGGVLSGLIAARLIGWTLSNRFPATTATSSPGRSPACCPVCWCTTPSPR
ncbi:hypothetical protein Kisp01_28610 [Kineosporia sp. NBRC 101677]|uniref:hypothetical protein n=1 Tax=Kineosporia sp. NBRC 101677 TaxID=3032197 RepID=UPI0024A591AB|nr:hypothetical protein [Kineosporia sp. NBRC 101677]GLY15846.1 hypothetical protein Kisp01_28610 [Kineosporia sp. NBRC 101677]